MAAPSRTTLDADTVMVHSILAASRQDAATLPAERARTLVLAWILSLENGVDLAREAAELKALLCEASAPGNPLLPHLTALLDEVSCHAGCRRGRRHLRADA